VPALRINEKTIRTDEFDVLGQDRGQNKLIGHLGLAKNNGESERTKVPVHEMGPPLQSSGSIVADVKGQASLDDDEIRKIRSFIDRHDGEHESHKLRRSKIRAYCVGCDPKMG
jgi:hypothetical protein